MGVVTQETALYERLSARDNLALYAALYGYRGQDKRRRVEAALHLADLTQVADRRAGTFSGGMARRLQIGRALLHSPQLVVLDEPTLGVDPVQRAGLWDHIRRLRDGGKTVLLTTNLMEEAAALCGRLAIMRDGRLAAPVDTPANLRRGRGAVITVAAEALPDVMRQACTVLRADPDVTGVTVTPAGLPGRYRLQVTAAAPGSVTGKVIMHLAGGGVTIRDVAARTATLDEVFLAVTGSSGAAR
jgi:ABC-2 type transport system ATP-binding protein